MLNENEAIESLLEKNPWISSIRGNVIDDADKEFKGNVDLRGSDITDIGHQLSRVKGDVYLTRLPISNTGVLSYVGGDLDLGGTNISRLEDLFALKYVGVAYVSWLEVWSPITRVGSNPSVVILYTYPPALNRT